MPAAILDGLTPQQRYRLKHPDRIREAQKRWYAKNPEYNRIAQRRDYQKDPIPSLLRQIRYRAKKEGVPFSLTAADINVPEFCPVLGIKMKPYGVDPSTARRNEYATVDRIVPSLGYVSGNIRVISFRANRLKNNATIEELRAVLRYMEEHAT